MHVVSLWTLLEAGFGALAVFTLLYTLASRLGFNIELHRLKLDTQRLRRDYERRLAELRMLGGESITTEAPPMPQEPEWTPNA